MKYEPLIRHLRALRTNEWPTTFGQVEEILGRGERLPDSARKERPWWHGHRRHHVALWRDAGWCASHVNLRQETVVFRRLDTPAPKAATVPKP